MQIIPLTSPPPFSFSEEIDGSKMQVGANTIYFRAVDVAGNTSTPATYRTALISFGGDAPTFPGDAQLTVTPNNSTNNNFALEWDPAVASEGKSVAMYYYMINTAPPATASTLTGNSATYFATTSTSVSAREMPGVVRGSNTAYVVVVDNLGNYSPSSVLTATFSLESENPDPPKNFAVSDASIKEASLWRASLAWDVPDYIGVGNLTYRIQRSDDGIVWTSIGSTTGTAYVDTVPESRQYYWRVGSTDPSDISKSNPSYSNAQTLIPKGSYTTPADLTSGPVITSVTTKRAKILWTTSRNSDSKVAYGVESGKYFKEEPSNSTQTTDHEINLVNLKPNTTYYYVAKWTDEDGNTGISQEKVFETDSAPLIKEATPSGIGLDSAIISFTSVNASQVKIYYGVNTDFGGSKTIDTARQESSYSIPIGGLRDGTKYYFRLNGFDAEGEEYPGDVYSFETIARPKISDVTLQQVADTAETTVLVTWKSNTPITSVITVFPSDKPSESRDVVDLKLKSGEHTLLVTALQPATRYTLIVKGTDKLGNQAVSESSTFTTSVDTRPPAIVNMKIVGGTIPPVGFAAGAINAQLVITWDTDEPSTSQVEFGEGTGAVYAQKTVEDSNLTTNHVVVVSGLTPSQVYHLRAISKDAAGNVTNSIDSVTIAPKATQSALDLVIVNLSEIFGSAGLIR